MDAVRRLREIFLLRRSEPGPEDPVLLGRPDGEGEAMLWKNILEQWGIHALVRNVSATAYLRLGDLFEVWVLQRDLEEARQLVGIAGVHPSPEESPNVGDPSL
jgi:hypothetical protein